MCGLCSAFLLLFWGSCCKLCLFTAAMEPESDWETDWLPGSLVFVSSALLARVITYLCSGTFAIRMKINCN